MDEILQEPIRLKVPKDVVFLSQWKDFSIPDFPCIIDKQLTGCGFTEFCLRSPENVVLCSPRKVLLENKYEQHMMMQDPTVDYRKLIPNPNPEFPVYYAENKFEKDKRVDKNLGVKKPSDSSDNTIETINPFALLEFKKGIEDYYYKCFNLGIPCRILVTYDSFKYVREVLESLEQLDNFRIISDEFQAIIQDAKFKSNTEIKFLETLDGINKLCFVSATPILGAYLQMLPEFKDLPRYQLDWEAEDEDRVAEPLVEPFYCPRGIILPACEIVRDYKKGNFKTTVINIDGVPREVTSREAVFYVNCVSNICDIINKTGLKLDECNILCAHTEDNEKKLRKAFGLKSTDSVEVFGTVPLYGAKHKMFTFCTRTAYIGADFYSTNARNFIFSDANLDCLTVDIQIDLPQILGRQRLLENPWRNRADLYFRLKAKQESEEHGKENIDNKTRATHKLMELYYSADPEGKKELVKKFKKDYSNYRDDYVAINKDKNGEEILVFNTLVRVNDIMAWDLLQKNYKDIFKLFNSLSGFGDYREQAKKILKKLEDIQFFHNKMKFLYETEMPERVAVLVLNNIGDTDYSKYYWTISPERAKTLKYQRGNLEVEYKTLKGISSVDDVIYSRFQVGQKYSKSTAKSMLQEIYDTCDIQKTAKANDLGTYFRVLECKVQNPETGKRDAGFEIVEVIS